MGAMLQAIAVCYRRYIVLKQALAFLYLRQPFSYGFELFSKITGHGHYEIADAVASIIGAELAWPWYLHLYLHSNGSRFYIFISFQYTMLKQIFTVLVILCGV
jgi:hypothetical protein